MQCDSRLINYDEHWEKMLEGLKEIDKQRRDEQKKIEKEKEEMEMYMKEQKEKWEIYLQNYEKYKESCKKYKSSPSNKDIIMKNESDWTILHEENENPISLHNQKCDETNKNSKCIIF